MTFVLQQFFELNWADPLFALLIALAMSVGAFKISRHALDVLMDAEVDEKMRIHIYETICSVEGVCGTHDMRTRRDGDRVIVEAHVEMEATLSLAQAHEITEAVEQIIEKNFPNTAILIHQDPAGIEEKRLDKEIENNDPVKP